jgi:hypothetical protein
MSLVGLTLLCSFVKLQELSLLSFYDIHHHQ